MISDAMIYSDLVSLLDKIPEILVVDDSPINIDHISMILKKQGYGVRTCEDSTKVIEAICRQKPDLILLDVNMPKMNGFEVCRQIKLNYSLKDIPIIFLTAETDHDSIKEGFSSGAIDYIRKPFYKFDLIARVNNHINLKFCHSEN